MDIIKQIQEIVLQFSQSSSIKSLNYLIGNHLISPYPDSTQTQPHLAAARAETRVQDGGEVLLHHVAVNAALPQRWHHAPDVLETDACEGTAGNEGDGQATD